MTVILVGGRFVGRDGKVTLPGGPVTAYDMELGAPPRLAPDASGHARPLVPVDGVPVTWARGGEDLLAVFDVLAAGGGGVYEPSALAWHWNRRDYACLRRLMYDYGVGLMAYVTAAAVRQPQLAFGLARHAALGMRHVVGRSSPKNNGKWRDVPRELGYRERLRMVAGPVAYLRGHLSGRAVAGRPNAA